MCGLLYMGLSKLAPILGAVVLLDFIIRTTTSKIIPMVTTAAMITPMATEVEELSPSPSPLPSPLPFDAPALALPMAKAL